MTGILTGVFCALALTQVMRLIRQTRIMRQSGNRRLRSSSSVIVVAGLVCFVGGLLGNFAVIALGLVVMISLVVVLLRRAYKEAKAAPSPVRKD